MNLTAELRNMGARRLDAASELHHADLEAINTSAAPDRVAPVAHPAAALTDGVLTATLKPLRSEEHTSELQSLMRISYAVFCLKKKKTIHTNPTSKQQQV